PSRTAPPLALPSLPTRRSSDLNPSSSLGSVLAAQPKLARRERLGVLAHDPEAGARHGARVARVQKLSAVPADAAIADRATALLRSEEHTSELQSLTNLVCRLLL